MNFAKAIVNVVLIFSATVALAQTPPVFSAFTDFSTGTNGSSPTPTTLTSSTYNATLISPTWYTSNAGAGLLFSTSAKQTLPGVISVNGTYYNGSESTLGLRGTTTTSAGAVGFDYLQFANTSSSVTVGYFLRWSCPASVGLDCGALGGISSSSGGDYAVPHVEPPLTSGGAARLYLEYTGGLSSNYVATQPNVWYWVNVNYNEGPSATHYMDVCTASGSFLGTMNAPSASSAHVPNLIWAGISGEQPLVNGYIYDFANYVIDITGAFSTSACIAPPPNNVYPAASASQSDVNAVINGPTHLAVAGDQINIPAGTSTWTNTGSGLTTGLLVPGGVTLNGTGTPNPWAGPGQVTTSGTSVAWSSGSQFLSIMAGQPIFINGVIYTVSTYNSATSLTLTTSAGTQASPVPYAFYGSGVNTTNLIANTGTSYPMMQFTGVCGQTSKVQNLNIAPQSTATSLVNPIWFIGTGCSGGHPYFFPNNIYFNGGWNETGNGSNAASMIVVDNAYGAASHISTSSGSDVRLMDAHFSAYLGIGQYGDNSWAQPDTIGTGNEFYLESYLDYTATHPAEDTESLAGGSTSNAGGGRLVNRYGVYIASGNTTGPCYGHGTDSFGRPRGMRHLECNNIFVVYQSASQSLMGLRSGFGYSFGNIVWASPSVNQYINLFAERRSASFSPWSFGAGLGSYDTNDGTTYYTGTASGGNGSTTLTVSTTPWTTNEWQDAGDPYSVVDTTSGCSSEIISNTSNTLTTIGISPSSQVCTSFAPNSGDSFEILRASVIIDQPGHGYGSYISGSTPSPTGSVAEALNPVYEWNDSTSAGTTYFDIVANAGDLSLIANRDYYSQASGIQTSSTSPFNGTSGTGWGTLVKRPTTCTVQVGYWATDTNTLYLCETTNTWTASYSPYTYPYPLTSNLAITPPPVTVLFAKK